MAYRAFNYRNDPTVCVTVEGTVAYSTASALDLRVFTPIPFWVGPGAWIAVDLKSKDAPVEVCGRFGREPGGSAFREGHHLPDEITREIQAWCEEYVRANADKPMILRAEGGAVAARPFSYNTLQASYSADIENHRRRVEFARARR